LSTIVLNDDHDGVVRILTWLINHYNMWPAEQKYPTFWKIKLWPCRYQNSYMYLSPCHRANFKVIGPLVAKSQLEMQAT